jgi:hypothetical protein
MVAQTKPKTYNRYTSGVTAVGSVALIENINPSLLNHYIGVQWFSDAVGTTNVVPTAGTVLLEALDDVTEQFTVVASNPLDATVVTDKNYYISNMTAMQATPTGVVGAAFYKLVVSSNLEASTESIEFAKSFETSERGTTALGVFIQDQTTNVLTIPFLKSRAALTLASAPAVDQNVITLTGGHGVTAGEVIEIAELDTQQFMQSKVVSISVNDITLDAPVNFPYQTTDVIQASSDNMLVDGSVTPVVFSILPLPSQSGDMVRINMEIRGGTNQTMDFTKFGSDAPITNGCVIRINNGDGTFKNLFNFKSNGDFIEQGFDNSFLDPATGNTITGFIARVTWGGQSKHGVVIRLEGSAMQALEVVIQDDLTATNNTLFKIIAQGHELQGE